MGANSGRRGRRIVPRAVDPAQLEPPAGMSSQAIKVWRVLAPIVAKRVEFETVRHFLVTYCDAWVMHIAAHKRAHIDRNQHKVWRSSYELVERTSKHLGLSPMAARHVLAAQKANQAIAKQQATWRDQVE